MMFGATQNVLQIRLAVLVVEPRAQGDVHLVERDRALAVERRRRCRPVPPARPARRERQQRRQHDRREVVRRRPARSSARTGTRRPAISATPCPTAAPRRPAATQTRISCVNCAALFLVAARQQRRRRVIEIGHVVRLPVARSRSSRRMSTSTLRAEAGTSSRGRRDWCAPRNRARHGAGSSRSDPRSIKRVVAVARALAGVDQPRLPLRRRRQQQLPLAERRVAESMSWPVMSFVVKPSRWAWPIAKPTRGLPADRTGRVRAHVDGREVPEGDDGGTGPLRQGRPDAADVNQPAERVPAEQRALRSADELHLADVEELDARGVGVQLRDAVDICRDGRVGRARPDPAKPADCSAFGP